MQPLLQWKSSKYYMLWVCVCSLRYTACNAHALYRHLWRIRVYYIFYIISQTAELKKKLFNMECVSWLSVRFLSETFFILRITDWDMIINVYCPARKVLRLQWNSSFLNRFLKNNQISNLMKICPMGVKLFHEDGQTDRQTWRS